MEGLIGGAQAQIRSSWADPDVLTVRGLLEAVLYLRYLLERDQKRRGYAYLVAGLHRELRWVRSLDTTTPEGKELRAILRKDRRLSRRPLEPNLPVGLDDAVVRLEGMLRRPGYVEAEGEYQRLRSERGKRPAWYSLFQERRLTTIEQLALYLGETALYHGVYRSLSEDAHAAKVYQGRLSGDDEGRMEILQLRWPGQAQQVTLLAVKYQEVVHT